MPIPPRLALRKTEPTIATDHNLPSGPGWQDVGGSDRDALDEMISGLKEGNINESDEVGAVVDVAYLGKSRPWCKILQVWSLERRDRLTWSQRVAGKEIRGDARAVSGCSA